MATQLKVLYSINDPETGEVKYIGQTNDLKRRTQEHYRGNQDVDKWMRALKEEKKEPEIRVISRHHRRINSHERIAIIRERKNNRSLLNRLIPVHR